MNSLVRSEWERIWGRKKTIGCFIACFLILVLDTVFMHRSLLYSGGAVFYGFGMDHPYNETMLNALNFSTFLLRDLSFVLVTVFLPMLIADSFNGEYTSGALRLVLIRPPSRGQLLMAKWISQSLLVFLLIGLTFIYGTVVGWLLFPHVSETTYFQIDQPLSVLGAYGYNLVFYVFTFVVCLAILGLGSLISSLMPNAILAFLSTVGALVGAIYISDHLSFLINSGTTIYQIMSGPGMGFFVLKIALIMLISYVSTFVFWNKRNWII